MQPKIAEQNDAQVNAGPRLLVCDDSDEQRNALSVLLQAHGYEVDEAADGQSALQLLKARPYAMLLLDLQMPQTDGFDVLAYAQKHMPKLSVVLLSGLAAEEIGDGLNRLPRHELPPLLLKPININQLVQIIELTLAGELP